MLLNVVDGTPSTGKTVENCPNVGTKSEEMKQNLQNIRYNGMKVEVFYKQGCSYLDILPVLVDLIGPLVSLEKVGVKHSRQYDWKSDPDTHRITIMWPGGYDSQSIIWWNSRSGCSTGICLGEALMHSPR